MRIAFLAAAFLVSFSFALAQTCPENGVCIYEGDSPAAFEKHVRQIESAQPSSYTATSSKALSCPLPGAHHVSSGVGYRFHPILKTRRYHAGIDLSAIKGTPIYAMADGVVESFVGEDCGKGLLLRHRLSGGKSITVKYCHASERFVSPHAQVRQNEMVARVGSTGRSTGPHLHVEIYENGVLQNPLSYLRGCIG